MPTTGRPFTVSMDCGHTDALSLDDMSAIVARAEQSHTCPTCGDRQHVHSFEVETDQRPRPFQVIRFAMAALRGL